MRTSPIDSVFFGAFGYPMEFAFPFAQRQSRAHLQASLDANLALFPPADCDLLRGEDSDRFVPASEPISITEEARPDVSWDTLPQQIGSFAPPLRQRGSQEAGLALRLSHMGEGSVLGVSMSHILGDGFSLFSFLTSWARIACGLPGLQMHFDRELLWSLAAKDQSAPLALDEYRRTPEATCGLHWEKKREARVWSAERFAHMDFPIAGIQELVAAEKAKGNAVSSNDIVCALAWKEQLRSEGGTLQGDARLCMPVDLRRFPRSVRLDYFGNAVTIAILELPKAEVLDLETPALAARIRHAVDAVDEASLPRRLNGLVRLRGLAGADALEELHVRPSQNGLLITNLSRVPTHEIDFGSGAASDAIPILRVDRCAVVLTRGNELRVSVANHL